jgi:hypothetical protein
MSDSKEWAELRDTLRLFTIWTVSSLIDSAFLALWVSVQWIVNKKVVTPLGLTGIDKFVLTIFQVLFAVSTLAPVAITIYRDIRIMLLRTNRRIRSEIKISEYHEPD